MTELLGVYSFDEDEWTDDPASRTYRLMGLFDLDEQEWVEQNHPTVDVGIDPPVTREEFAATHSAGSVIVYEPSDVPGEVIEWTEDHAPP